MHDDDILCHCNKCQKDKPIEDFYSSLLNHKRTAGTCKVCWNAYTAERRRLRDEKALKAKEKKAILKTPLPILDHLQLELVKYVVELGGFVQTLASVNRIEDMAPRMSDELQGMLGNLPGSQAHAVGKVVQRADAVRRRAIDEGRTSDGQRVEVPKPLTAQDLEACADVLKPGTSETVALLSKGILTQGEAISDPVVREQFYKAQIEKVKAEAAALGTLDTQAAPKRASIAEVPTLRRPTKSQATTPWPKRASDVTEQELQAHVEHLKALIEASEANPDSEFPTPRGTTMRAGKEYGADGTLVVTELDPVYQALSRERSKPDSLDGF